MISVTFIFIVLFFHLLLLLLKYQLLERSLELSFILAFACLVHVFFVLFFKWFDFPGSRVSKMQRRSVYMWKKEELEDIGRKDTESSNRVKLGGNWFLKIAKNNIKWNSNQMCFCKYGIFYDYISLPFSSSCVK